MRIANRQLLTIVAEAALEQRLIDDLKRLGASGYTASKVRGEGRTGRHLQYLTGPSVELETIVNDDVAEAILTHVAENYFTHYAIVAWLTPVSVLRPERF
ncbi:MAG: hypothetical protein WD360_04475 [Nitriliruptoraceae bacterium]